MGAGGVDGNEATDNGRTNWEDFDVLPRASEAASGPGTSDECDAVAGMKEEFNLSSGRARVR